MEYNKVIELIKETNKIVNKPIDSQNIHIKGRADFVTDRDIEVQEFIKNGLHKLYPNISFSGLCSRTSSGRGDRRLRMWI